MTRFRLVRTVLSFGSIVLVAAFVAGRAVALDVDARGDKELARLTRKIDKSAADGDAGRVTARIVGEWKGTTFRLDAGGAPRALTAQDVAALRAKRLGFGEISILLALTAKQPDPATAKPLSEILATRQAGAGWGVIARDLGYKSLGAVVRRVTATERSVTRVAMADRHGKVEKTEKMDRPDKPERLEKPEAPGRPAR